MWSTRAMTSSMTGWAAVTGVAERKPELVRPIADDRDALHHAWLREVVRRRVVLRRAVVPEHEVAGLPTKAHLVLRVGRLAAQQIEQLVALVAVQPDDVLGE